MVYGAYKRDDPWVVDQLAHSAFGSSNISLLLNHEPLSTALALSPFAFCCLYSGLSHSILNMLSQTQVSAHCVSIPASVLACPWGSDRISPQLQPLRAPRAHSPCSLIKGSLAYLPPLSFALSPPLLILLSPKTGVSWPLPLLFPLPINLPCEPSCKT